MPIVQSFWNNLRNIFATDQSENRQSKFDRPSPSTASSTQLRRMSRSASPRRHRNSRSRSRHGDESDPYLPTPPSTVLKGNPHQTPMAIGKLTPQRRLIRDSFSPKSSKISKKFGSSPNFKADVDANRYTQIATLERVNPDKGLKYDYYEELRTSQNKVMELQRVGWPKDATYLFHKISMRGYEPLMPDNWIIDFDTVPLSLFTDKHRGAFIKADRESDFRATYALKNLISISCRARDAIRTSRSPERILHHGILDYIRWAFRDTNLSFATTIPNLVIDANPNDRPASELEARMLCRLEGLATRWKMNLRIYDSVEGSEAENLHSNISTNHSGDSNSSDITDEGGEDGTSKCYWQGCYAPSGSRTPVSSSASSSPSSLSSSASFEPGTSINNTISSYSYNSSSSSSSSSSNLTNSSNTYQPLSTIGHNTNNKTIRYTHPLPTLYGIIISHTVVAIVAYDPNSTSSYSSLSPASPTFTSLPHPPSSPSSPSSLIPPCLRTISFFDLGDGKYDVWNALALAIVVVHCRNALLDLAHEGVLLDDVGMVIGKGKEGEEEGEEDDKDEEEEDDDDVTEDKDDEEMYLM